MDALQAPEIYFYMLNIYYILYEVEFCNEFVHTLTCLYFYLSLFCDSSNFASSVSHEWHIKINPIALRMAKTLWCFGHSECNRVKILNRKDLDGMF